MTNMGVFSPIFYDLVQISELLPDFKIFIYKFCYSYRVFFLVPSVWYTWLQPPSLLPRPHHVFKYKRRCRPSPPFWFFLWLRQKKEASLTQVWKKKIGLGIRVSLFLKGAGKFTARYVEKSWRVERVKNERPFFHSLIRIRRHVLSR